MPPQTIAATDPPTRAERSAIQTRLNFDDVSFTFTRSGGPGGQNVNKVNTRVTLRFNLNETESFTEPEKARIRQRLPGRISRDGFLRIVSSRYRTQRGNREATLERLVELLAIALRRRKARKPSRVPAGVKRRRVDDKRVTGEKKRQRRQQRPSSDGW